MARFVDVPWRLLAAWPQWVPPLRAVVRDSLDTRRNPFYRDADRALFVAERAGRVVGRVAAIENRAHNRHHADRVGFFGFFDCADDPEAARALFDRAEAWLRERGLTSIRGPISPSMNHESGLLVEGCDIPPVIMTPWNPAYYDRLVAGTGFRTAKDLLGYWVPSHNGITIPKRLTRLADHAAARSGVTFRTLDVSTLESEARKVLELYNSAWADNWGFVPPSWDEFWHTARDLKSVLMPDYSFVAEVEGEIVGFMLVARDINRVLTGAPSGRLWPSTIVRLIRGLPRLEHGRVILLGLRPEYRHQGLFPVFLHEAWRRGVESSLEGAEASWVLADNHDLTAPFDALGLEAYKRWRIYERPIR